MNGKGASKKINDTKAKNPFFLRNESIVNTLVELLDTLKDIDDETFTYHVNNEKNDFSSWIRFSIGKSSLANKISKTISKEEIITAIEAELVGAKKQVTKKAAPRLIKEKIITTQKTKPTIKPKPAAKTVKKSVVKKPIEKKTNELALNKRKPKTKIKEKVGMTMINDAEKSSKANKADYLIEEDKTTEKTEDIEAMPPMYAAPIEPTDEEETKEILLPDTGLDPALEIEADKEKSKKKGVFGNLFKKGKSKKEGMELHEVLAKTPEKLPLQGKPLPEDQMLGVDSLTEEIKEEPEEEVVQEEPQEHDKKEFEEKKEDKKEVDDDEVLSDIPSPDDFELDSQIDEEKETLPELPKEITETKDESTEPKKEKKGLFKKIFSKKDAEKIIPAGKEEAEEEISMDIPSPEEIFGDEKEEGLPLPDEDDSLDVEDTEFKRPEIKEEEAPEETEEIPEELPNDQMDIPDLPDLPSLDEEKPDEKIEEAKAEEKIDEEPFPVVKETVSKKPAVKKPAKPKVKKAPVKKIISKRPQKVAEVVKESKELKDVLSIKKEKIELDMKKFDDKINQKTRAEIDKKQAEIANQFTKLEEKMKELENFDKELVKREANVQKSEAVNTRTSDSISKLKRKHDLEVRERTKYIRDAEKDFAKKSKEIDKKLNEIKTLQIEMEYKKKFLDEKEKDVKEREAMVSDREKTAILKEKETASIVKEHNKKNNELSRKEGQLGARESKITVKEKDLKELENSLKGKESDLTQKETTLNKKEKDLAVADKALNMAVHKYSREKDSLEDEEFHEYLNRKLSEISSNADMIGKRAGVDDQTPSYQPVSGGGDINNMIEQCRELISKGDFDGAKKVYNQIRLDFYKVEATDQQKGIMHNQIRALYDDINIGMLNR